MGNWRTVHIDGTIDHEQVDAARKACLHNWESDADDQPYHALSYGEQPSLCGLHEWPSARINAVGNCAERDFSVEDVAEALRIVQQAAPSLRVKVHCGGDYEDKTCVATINVTETGVSVDPPEVSEIPEISQAQIMGRLFAALI